MTGPQLATLGTIAWAIVTLSLLVLGTSGHGNAWTIVPGLVRGVRDWTAARASALDRLRISPWAIEAPPPRLEPGRPTGLPTHPTEPDEIELGIAILEDLGERRLD